MMKILLLSADRAHFDRLSPLHPNKKFNFEFDPTAFQLESWISLLRLVKDSVD